MRTLLLIAAATLPLAACNQGPSVSLTNASGEEVADAMKSSGASGAMISPGRYEGTTVLSVEMPEMAKGMPPEFAEKMMKELSKPHAFVNCVTPEQAKNPRADMMGEAEEGCRYDKFEMGNGRISAVMSCGVGTAQQQMEMNGTYSATEYNMTAKGKGPQGEMSVKVDARRVGECRGTKDEE